MENGSEAQDQPKAPKDRNKSEDASQAPLAPSPTRSGKLSQNSSSKFLAEPLLPISKAKPSPFTTSQTQSAVTLSMKRSSTSAVSPQPNQKSVEPQIATKWEYDVYARPYIPSAFRAANHEPGHVVFTEAKHKVNFEEYTNTFVGKAFIPKRIAMPTHDNAQIQADGMLLTEASYLEYFLSLWKIELEAKKRENESFALYKVPILPLPMPDGQDLYALSIPGLREDSPFVEIGDTIQLRQLWLDSAGNLMGVPVMMPGPGNPYQHSPVVLSWGGVQYDASVYSISRVQETVYLRIAGLERTSMCFNVMIPLKKGPIAAQKFALGLIHREFMMRGYGLGSSNSLKDLHEGICRKTANIVLETTSRKIQINGPEKNKKLSSGLQHTSVTQNDWVRQMLFPVESDGVFQTKLRTINYKRGLFDYKLNYEQLQAVNSVCANEYGTLPFLISGPPGTGKTKSLVELALQLLNTTQIAHILICAPSEAAADTLAQRLRRQLSPHQLLRLNGPGRDDKEVPGDLMQYCYIESEMFYLPPFKKLMQYNVVVTTTRDAAILAEARLTNADLYHIETSMLSAFHPEDTRPPPSLHWGALLMDEAAQATELEALVPISVIIPPSSYPKDLPQPRFVMAGDQNQLGPRTASRNPGFSKSLFARLFDRPVYSNHPLSRSKVRPSASPPVLEASMLPMLYPPFVNLVHNYRSHPAILSIPSTLFYNDTLIPETPIPQTALQVSNLWQGRRWPLLYIPHAGLDEIERDGGGWYNVSEARVACNIAQYLVTYDMVRQSDICIMSPFAAQVRMLRAMIRGSAYGGGSGLWEVNIGPLEAFQGLESRTVIICTTRTRARFLEPDRKRGLGVVGERRKMNVAVTRAKEALIVIGSPEVLARDEWWKEWVSFCSRNGLVGQGDREGIGMRVFEEEKKKGTFEGGKVGVLEKALLVKEKREQETAMGNQKRTLGGASAGVGIVGEDEMWEAGLKAALEGWGDIEEDEYEEGEGEVGNHDEETQSEDEKTNASGSDASAL